MGSNFRRRFCVAFVKISPEIQDAVMAGFIPASHVLQTIKKDADARVKPGHNDVQHFVSHDISR
jgi:hypothetical protein